VVKGRGSGVELGRLDTTLELDSIEPAKEETGESGWIREWLTKLGVGSDKPESEVVLELEWEIPREEIGSKEENQTL